MPSLQEGQVRILSGSSIDEVEALVNDFLAGDGTSANPRKDLRYAPQLVIDSGTFYVTIGFRRANIRDVEK